MARKRFRRPLSECIKRIGESWRRPKGLQSKVRQKIKGKLKMPDIGYKKPEDVRGLHPCGLKEVLVRNLKDLENLDPSKVTIRISSKVGKKKRSEIVKKAKEMNIKILNE
ncbi:MAG: 50S ribosomal protein L32e [Candidatus Aenigmarchaeota archaeon]|nr:50S ribosomal protein L32e [Candidatus Aenigmarchaeota archaeon]MDW8160020.1 50S ribosomal protein L32e [Candidatus Aenigmarchaeota archaeon]